MSNFPFFSVCIPTYNRAHLISAAIDSVLAQDFNDYELLIVDNASTDNTQKVLKRYTDHRIRVIRNPATVSMYANHNICVEQARAEWVVFLHSDDVFFPSALTVLWKLTHSHAGIDIFFPAHQVHEPYVNSTSILLKEEESVPSLLRWPTAAPTGVLYSKAILLSHPFDQDSILCADLDFLFRVLLNGGTMMIRSNDIVNIQLGTHQESANLSKSGSITKSSAQIIAKVVKNEKVVHYLLLDLKNWKKKEIVNLMITLAHADCRELITVISKNTGLQLKDYRWEIRHYWQVLVYLYLGKQVHIILFKLYLKLRNLYHLTLNK
jgi:glycosyltransferase involved in cell wall biosynthesis